MKQIVENHDASLDARLRSPVPSASGVKAGTDNRKPIDRFAQEIKKWVTRLRNESIAHRESAKSNKIFYFVFGFLPISVLSAATSLVSQTKLESKDRIVLLLSCTNALCAGVAAYWNWGELAEKHSNTSKKIDVLLAEAFSVKYYMLEQLSKGTEHVHQSVEWAKFQALTDDYNKVKVEAPPLSVQRCRKVDMIVKEAVSNMKSLDLEALYDCGPDPTTRALDHIVGSASQAMQLSPVEKLTSFQNNVTRELTGSNMKLADAGASLKKDLTGETANLMNELNSNLANEGASFKRDATDTAAKVVTGLKRNLADEGASYNRVLIDEAAKGQVAAEDVRTTANTLAAHAVAASSSGMQSGQAFGTKAGQTFDLAAKQPHVALSLHQPAYDYNRDLDIS